MRNTSKMTTLENKFPLLAVEQGCIISKDADITVAFEVELPELYTVTGAEYEAIHGCWCKAIKVLPDFSVVHKQDWFIKEKLSLIHISTQRIFGSSGLLMSSVNSLSDITQ